MKKILMLNANKVEEGTYYRALYFARELVKKGYKVRLRTVSRSNRFISKSYIRDGVEIVEGANFMYRPYSFAPIETVARIRDIVFGGYDFVYGFEYHPSVSLPIYLTRRLKRYRFISDWCDWHGGGYNIYGGRKWLQKIDSYFEEKIRHYADAVTVICTALQKRAESIGVSKDKIFLIPEGTDPEFIRVLDQHNCCEYFGFDEDLNIVACIYDTGMQKTLTIFAEILKKLPQSMLILIGRKRLHVSQFAQQLGISEKVYETGFCSDEDLNKYLACADICIFPMEDSLFNRARFPHKICDYLAAGKPVVINPVGDIKDYFKKYRVGYLAQFNEEDFADKVVDILQSPDLAEELGRNARSLIEDVLNWGSLTDQLDSILNALRIRSQSS